MTWLFHTHYWKQGELPDGVSEPYFDNNDVYHTRLSPAMWCECGATQRWLSVNDGMEEVLASDRHAERVRRSTGEAHAIGVNGVPAFLLDRRFLVLGAQPRETFEQAFDQLHG